MKRILVAIMIVLSVVVGQARSWTPAEVPNVQKENRMRYLSNPEGIISPETQARIDASLADLRARTSAEVSVVVIDRVDSGTDIENFATELFDLWQPGKGDKDNGMLIVVATGDRKAVIRTGYGLEGVVPDILAGRIIRQTMIPEFKEGNYDAGTEGAVNAVVTILTDPEAAAEIFSSEKDNFDDDISGDSIWKAYVSASVFVGVASLLLLLIGLVAIRKRDRYAKYKAMDRFKLAALVLSFLFLLMPLPTALLIIWLMHHWRNAPRRCPNCRAKMQKLDEQTDNQYLTPAQDAEENLGSVDYDVWLCPSCGETDVYPFVNKQSTLHECANCHARTARLVRARQVVPPTTSREGIGVKEYYCENCHKSTQVRYSIAKLASAAPIIIGTGGIGGRGGGGFSGGGFGGGMTGGGGASGGW